MDYTKINYTEMKKLIIGLGNLNIDFEIRPLYLGGIMVIVNNWEWDAVLFPGSYGSEKGLIEICGSIVQNNNDDDDDVEGYLTAEEILNRVRPFKVGGYPVK